MPKTRISEYSTTNSNNTDINSINIDEGCAPSGINNAIREVMVHLKNWQTNASGDGATFASLVVQGTGSFTGAVTMSAGATLSGTNTLSGSNIMSGNINSSGTNTFSGSQVISGNINSSGTTNTFSGGNILSGTNTLSGATIISGNFNATGTTNTFSNALILGNNLTFTGTGNRITGDFSNATLANRVMFQASTTNGATVVGIVPNGTSTDSALSVYNANPATNSSGGTIYANLADFRISSDKYGTGTYLPMTFYTGGTERARITSGGDLLVGQNSTSAPGEDNTTRGASITAGGKAFFSNTSDNPVNVNRNTNDGVLISLRQDGVQEGSISVSGNTVSYNAFAGSHWSQLSDGSKPEILRGTVMESINELVEWPGEPTSERLCRVKISDTAGSKKVYGVFMCWDEDWTATNDMLVTSVGAFICRVNGSVTVQEGDLLESNGDGTARVQTDDIIRSSTIGKVTCTTKTYEYADGSYCVPTVLYCG